MPELKTKAELALAARTLAQSMALVQRGATTYVPVDYETLNASPPPARERTIWLPLSREDVMQLANQIHDILFFTDSEIRNFELMLQQHARRDDRESFEVLIKTDVGLKVLTEDGELEDHVGNFRPNFIQPVMNEDTDDLHEVYQVMLGWLGNEESLESLLHHLATALSPGYSAVKYVILLGEGRNGKGLLLTMLLKLFGQANISHVTRQELATGSTTCIDLNDKLLNIVFDGQMAYIKDSSNEKTVIAGEPIYIRPLYSSGAVKVQTNALFIEALNQEPKARDKSPALQKRMARFRFDNVYGVDKKFERHMTSERMLGALLTLLLSRYVKDDEIADKLELTTGSLELQMEQVWMGSPVLQFLEHLNNVDPGLIKEIQTKGIFEMDFIAAFRPWLQSQGQQDRTDGDLRVLIKGAFALGRKAKRINNKPSSATFLTVVPTTNIAIDYMKEVADDAAADIYEGLVGDGHVLPGEPDPV